ncbi:hypothetical protein [Acidithrix ferrooxidans]|uniref:Glyoxalase/bleomycin resistance protein/dioxygenase superfamily protein n=1 Tax=Acidithrix ferrooxidans TaxID=1280514 RepID=A0A0D8HI51_9ACTN|nr:hypothetical protein [Acidithrix ferrooxidans]KJF17437.1 hypothetical protein AXFE_17150 [Acidithrix ferrooxidans]
MSDRTISGLDHVAILARDIEWHRRFFEEALAMKVTLVDGAEDIPSQLWIVR